MFAKLVVVFQKVLSTINRCCSRFERYSKENILTQKK